MKLPDNWRTLPAKDLVLDYQRPAFKCGELHTVNMIGDEMRKRLEVKGLKKTQPLGWVKWADIVTALNEGILTEKKDGSLVPVARLVEVYSKAGNKVGTKPDFTRFANWLKR